MKKILVAAFALVIYADSMAQTPEDALRLSWLPATGTARSQGVGNANGAMGGEISTMFSNPGNIGFYKTGDFVVTGGLNLNNNNASYFGQTTQTNNTSGFLGTTGVVFGKMSRGNGSVKSSALGIAINRTADFNNRVTYKNSVANGANAVPSSMADYFVEDLLANGNNGNPNSTMALETGWVVDEGNGYSSPAIAEAIANGLEQTQVITSNGGITELGVTGAFNLNEKVFIGGTLGLPMLRYGVTKAYTEQDINVDNLSNGFDYAGLDEDLVTTGAGINLKAGVVVKATENFRLGFAAHSPTFYSLTDRYYSEVGTNLDYPNSDDYNSVYQELEYDYNLTTPYKLLGSFSYMFGNVNDVESQKGFVSGDIEYVNHMASSFRNTNNGGDYGYSDLNNAIDNAYKGTVNARLGTELKFNPVMVRFGGAYYGNPYRDIAGEEGQLIQATGGLGYRNKGFFIDLGYVHNIGKDVIFPYRLTGAPFEAAKIKSSSPRVLLTLGFKL